MLQGNPTPTASSVVASVSKAVESLVWTNAQDTAQEMHDPLRAALPSFTYSMPVQVVILGVTLTLITVLLVHLLFTLRYHAPLSKLNYALQTAATGISLANTAAQLHVVMHEARDTGRQWPYMFDYIEVRVPRTEWGVPRSAAWLLLQAINMLATHSTHIQFLTMLFPSVLEAGLILGLLGPLALASSALNFTTLSPHPAVNDLGDAIRDTCTSSLTLLYTMALFIWGLTINRSRAWRTEGGTSSFGILALFLGVVGTAVNFVEIREERMRWLPGVVTCILLWQSWLGFWWWVGAGMWTGEAEDVERKREKERRKEERRRKKREATALAAAGAGAGVARGGAATGDGGSGSGEATGAARSTVGSLRQRFQRTRAGTNSDGGSAPSSGGGSGEAIELRELGGGGGNEQRPAATGTSTGVDAVATSPTGALSAGAAPERLPRTRTQRSSRLRPPGVGGVGGDARSDSNSSDLSSSGGPASEHFYSPLVDYFSPFFRRLRLAHETAALEQAAKPSGLPEDVRRGWGIRALMMRGKKERGERRQAARGRVEEGAEMDAGERRAGFELDGGARLDEEEEDGDDDDEWQDDTTATASTSGREETHPSRRQRASPSANATARRTPNDALARESRNHPGAGESTSEPHAYPPRRPAASSSPRAAPSASPDRPSEPTSSGSGPTPPPPRAAHPSDLDRIERGGEGQTAWWWRGWVGRWRLKDVSHWD
ncbi:hypothetical protein JCM10908_001760 [Rhodotorula pacifica]|uniref:uncharacterized protein n=1 Tax=Rhodotorula pacifica TaxID=1495444 RepID=UPI00318102A6